MPYLSRKKSLDEKESLVSENCLTDDAVFDTFKAEEQEKKDKELEKRERKRVREEKKAEKEILKKEKEQKRNRKLKRRRQNNQLKI